jgi:hypothetical protein
MSNHFTYEINERNVRLQLKGHRFDAKESDWLRFQEHAAENVSFRKGIKVADKFNITLNRNIILPVIFGIIILGFSLLLVNFMSIKNNNNSLKTAPAQIEKSTAPELKAVATPKKMAPCLQKQTLTTIEANPSTDFKKVNTSINDLNAIEIAKQTPINKIEPAESTTAPTQIISDNLASTSESVVDEALTKTPKASTKKGKNTEPEATSSDPSPELRSTGVSEHQEAEGRPE